MGGFFLFFFDSTHCLKIHGTFSNCSIRHLLLLWCDFFEAVFELLGSCLGGATQGCVIYDPPWYFTYISPGKASAFSVMARKNIREAMGSQLTHFMGGVGGGAESTTAPQVFVIQLSVYFLNSPLHNSSSRLAAVLPGLQVTNVTHCSSPWLNHTRRRNGIYLPALLQAAQSTMAELKGSWEQAAEQQAVESKPR